MNYKDYLTEEERMECWKAGMVRKMASCGVKPSDYGMEKYAFLGIQTAGDALKAPFQVAGHASGAVKNTATTAMALALLLGVPLGGMLHYLDRTANNDSKKIEKLKKIRDAYQQAAVNIERNAELG